jgi:oligopeptide/dipeptide ABC transporter ATP-binding protein
MQPLLSVHDVTVSYRSGDRAAIRALEDVTFEIAAGEAVGLLGESGCGKTTLALTLLKSLPQAARVLRGSVIFRGTNLLILGESGLQMIRGAGISMVHQEPGLALNPVIRVGDQVSEVLRAHQTITAARAKEEAQSLLMQVGFAADSRVWDAYPHQLSGGQQQRVAIAQAIACRPPLVIADEPTTALDVAAQIEILALLKSLKEKLQMAVLMITHETWPLTQFVDRVLVMYAGRIIEEGPARRILDQPLHPYTCGLLRSRPMGLHKRPLEPIPGEPPDPANLPAGCAFSPRCSDVMNVCQSRLPQHFSPETSHHVACFKYAE